MKTEDDALALLSEARSAILQGNYPALSRLSSQTEKLIAQATSDPDLAARIHGFALRNQRLLEHALRAVKLVQETVELRRNGVRAFTYYGADGAQTSHVVADLPPARRV